MRIERDHMDQRGFALLIVLWIFMVLFVLGAEFASGMRQKETESTKSTHASHLDKKSAKIGYDSDDFSTAND